MYIELMLKNTKFNANDKIKIGSFLTPLFNSLTVKSFSYEETEERGCLIVEMNKITYFFYKPINSNSSISLYAFDYTKDLHIEYYYYASFLPIQVYTMIDGELSGKGHKEKLKVRRNLFQTIYLEPEFKLDVSYNYKGKNLKSITVYLQHYKLTNRDERTMLSLVNNYFTVDIKEKRIMERHPYKGFSYSSILADHMTDGFKNNPDNNSIYTEELGEMFLSSINSKSYFDNVLSDSSIKETKNFIAIAKMFLI